MNKFLEQLKKVLNSRSLKYGSNSFILIAAVVAIAVLVNVLVGMGSFKWDLTSNKLYSIGDTTKNVLKDLNKDVTIYGLFDPEKVKSNDSMKEYMELLDQYKKNPHIKVEYVDPDKKPGFIKNELDPDNIRDINKNDFVFKCGNKVKKLTTDDLVESRFDQQSFQSYKTGSKAEQSFTGAIKYVTADKTPTIYFTEGHEEAKVDSDYKTAKGYIERNNYEVKSVNLVTADKVPDDAETLVIAAPKKDLTTDEVAKIKDYLKNGGKVIFMVDSLGSGVAFNGIDEVLKDYNVSLNNDKVKENDKQRHLPNNVYSIVPEVQHSSITSDLNPDQFVMLMPNSRSINLLKNQKEYITVTSLIKTSSKATGEWIDKTNGKNTAGPLDLAVAVENKGGSKPSKVLVIGNSTFMNDSVLQQYTPNGLIFFLNSLGWMQDKKDDVVIAPKSTQPGTLQIDAATASILSWVVVLLLPLMILGLGMFVWLRRRHL